MKSAKMILFGFVAFVFSVSARTENSRVLLVHENTEFKTGLVQEMKNQLQRDGKNVTIAQHTRYGLSVEDPENYGAIFITNSGVMSRVRPWIVGWTNSLSNENIIVHTTQIRSWEPDIGIDGVTSASANSDIPNLARQYVRKINNSFAKADMSRSRFGYEDDDEEIDSDTEVSFGDGDEYSDQNLDDDSEISFDDDEHDDDSDSVSEEDTNQSQDDSGSSFSTF
ncbi:hypothetical protein QA601_10070 [Chitinispirillales bacterium ANBcel5]|uniref:hypothetical protein n=1 Tax=Cellulosispirillum alkaliphilum TaxID=3039283 RepID=UPI002A53498E|nr:hypothetical protein [Chitinispirillales bacterium ANBcel5]